MICVNATFQKWYSEWLGEEVQWYFNGELYKSIDMYCDFHSGKF